MQLKQSRLKRNKFNRMLFIPPISSVFLFDLFIFIIVFFMTLMANFTERSIQFNLVISSSFLVKSCLGMYMRNIKSYKALRKLMIYRLMIDTVVIMPIIGYYQHTSLAYTYNYIIILFCIVISELILILKHCPHLYKKTIIESMETVQPS